jgi:two-component system, OmpR family, phosphate regulon sensor histidine kinase PhoR
VKQNKNRLTLALIITSVGLLLALQVLWLTNSYEKAYFDLKRETNGLFRTTLYALRDSMLVGNIRKVSVDTMYRREPFRVMIDTVSSAKIKPESISQIQIWVNAPGGKSDTLKNLIRPFANRVREGKVDGSNFILRLGEDSLAVDSIRIHYSKSLQTIGLNIPFVIRDSSTLTPPPFGSRARFFRGADPEDQPKHLAAHAYSNQLRSEWVRIDPFHQYAVEFTGFHSLLFAQIAPQILFSAFLTMLTTVAFVVMYRNIRAQQKLMELKNDFISNITHELKTPVTTVGVALEAIKNFKGQNNPKLTTEYLDIAQNELNRLNILTDKILKTAIFEDKGVTYTAETVDLHQVINQVMDSMKLVFEKQKAIVNFKTEGSDFNLMGGTTHLTSVIYNLLDNALKYSPVNPQIDIYLQENKETITLRIRDNGIGIASEYKKKVFEKFFRVPTGDVHNIKGYGLGLSYVDSVVRSHNGTIEVESEPGKGSEFIIRLPKI